MHVYVLRGRINKLEIKQHEKCMRQEPRTEREVEIMKKQGRSKKMTK